MEKQNKMKLFISQVMNGKSKAEIKTEIESAKEFANANGYELEDSYIKEHCPTHITGDNIGIWYLGKSLKHLANCEAIVMCPGTENARGCIVEKHNLKIYYL